jgi:hypothetical protein
LHYKSIVFRKVNDIGFDPWFLNSKRQCLTQTKKWKHCKRQWNHIEMEKCVVPN